VSIVTKDSIQEIIVSEYEKSQKNIQPEWVGEGWYKTTPNSFNYFRMDLRRASSFINNKMRPINN